MADPSIQTVDIAPSMVPVNMDIWAMFMKADIVVQIVIVVLFLASIWCWAIIIDKLIRLRQLKARTDEFEDRFWSGGSLEGLYDDIAAKARQPMELIFASAMQEWRRSTARGLSAEGALRASLRERIGQVMTVTLNREMERLENHLGFLATVGSTAPFVGLFGTVWGIMHSFEAIAATKNTNLAVVAPGIAEALFATALGLVAAIPAVVAYNKLSGDLARYGGRLEGFVTEFSAILSRQLEEHR